MLGDDYLIQSIALPSLLSNWTILKISFTQIIYTSKSQLQGNLEIAQSMYVFFFKKKMLHFHFMAKEGILWIKTILKVT